MGSTERVAQILGYVTKLPSDSYGLKWRPSIAPHYPDGLDWLGLPGPYPSGHFSDLDHRALEYAYNKLSAPPKLIVEIGVDVYPPSSTSTLLKLKPNECTYIGIDISDKSHLNNVENNVFTIQTDSIEYEKLYQLMDSLHLTEIDLFFVDGEHSVNEVLWEWKYWEKMSPNGVMAFHDINFHPGPITVLDAIDRDIFSVEYFGRGELDWGVGVVQRLIS